MHYVPEYSSGKQDDNRDVHIVTILTLCTEAEVASHSRRKKRTGAGLRKVVMATTPQLMNTTLSPVNTTTKSQEQILYQSAGAIVAAIVVGVIIIFSLVLIGLKMYNRRTRTERELGMKSTKTTNTPSTRAHHSSISQPTSLTSVPPDIHLENR
ncbi:noncompact myelin-associated protein [Phyllobates terribilis]|uniref:noncompact myelin-associated protein n=1 Tax=Phyllobates terribilis TaxID=111132 RepID=UPI003CCB2420